MPKGGILLLQTLILRQGCRCEWAAGKFHQMKECLLLAQTKTWGNFEGVLK